MSGQNVGVPMTRLGSGESANRDVCSQCGEGPTVGGITDVGRFCEACFPSLDLEPETAGVIEAQEAMAEACLLAGYIAGVEHAVETLLGHAQGAPRHVVGDVLKACAAQLRAHVTAQASPEDQIRAVQTAVDAFAAHVLSNGKAVRHG